MLINSNDLIQELRLRDIEVGITIDSIDEKKTSLRSNEDNYTQKVFYNLKKAAEMGVAQSVLSIIQEGNVSDLISMTRVFNSRNFCCCIQFAMAHRSSTFETCGQQ